MPPTIKSPNNGRVSVLLTGAHGCLGIELAKQFLQRGIIYYSHASQKRNQKTDIVADFRNPNNLNNLKDLIISKKINCLINNAGVYCGKELLECSEEDITNTINVNLIAPIILAKYFYEGAKKNHLSGKIININSIAGRIPNYMESVYCASKFGLAGFGSSLSINQKISRIEIIDCFIGGMKSKITRNRNNYADLMAPKSVAALIADLVESRDQYVTNAIEIRSSHRV